MRILVTGGVRSGKSEHAERLLADADAVTYVAPATFPDDPEWAARVEAHRARRQGHWATLESADLGLAFSTAAPGSRVLVDSLGSWLTTRLDALDAWAEPGGRWREQWLAELEAAVIRVPADAVVVTDEVGLGGISAHASGRLFADLLGHVNQRFASVCDEVHLVVAGRVLRL